MKAVNLKTEFLSNPIGIDIQYPRLMWACEGGKTQTAYQIVAKIDDNIIWDSGKVDSNNMSVNYPHKLISRQRVEWTVTLWNENDNEGESSSAYFEMGLLTASDWKAKWIAGNYKVNKKKRYPVDCFKKAFNAICVKRARLYITACGLYEVKLNGTRVGNFVFAPGYTDYRKRIHYQTYDVTDLINSGSNDLTIELADGWYRGACGGWGLRNQFGKQTKFIAQLELVGSDNKITYINSDETWGWSNDGAIRFADNQDGEVVEAYRIPAFSGKAKVTQHKKTPQASNSIPILEHETFKPKGAVCEWLFNTVCGIKVAGDRQFTVEPKVGGSLDFAQAEYDSIYGKVVSSWHKKGGKVTYSITIPTNTTAKIVLPGITRIVGAGNYSFEI